MDFIRWYEQVLDRVLKREKVKKSLIKAEERVFWAQRKALKDPLLVEQLQKEEAERLERQEESRKRRRVTTPTPQPEKTRLTRSRAKEEGVTVHDIFVESVNARIPRSWLPPHVYAAISGFGCAAKDLLDAPLITADEAAEVGMEEEEGEESTAMANAWSPTSQMDEYQAEHQRLEKRWLYAALKTMWEKGFTSAGRKDVVVEEEGDKGVSLSKPLPSEAYQHPTAPYRYGELLESDPLHWLLSPLTPEPFPSSTSALLELHQRLEDSGLGANLQAPIPSLTVEGQKFEADKLGGRDALGFYDTTASAMADAWVRSKRPKPTASDWQQQKQLLQLLLTGRGMDEEALEALLKEGPLPFRLKSQALESRRDPKETDDWEQLGALSLTIGEVYGTDSKKVLPQHSQLPPEAIPDWCWLLAEPLYFLPREEDKIASHYFDVVLRPICLWDIRERCLAQQYSEVSCYSNSMIWLAQLMVCNLQIQQMMHDLKLLHENVKKAFRPSNDVRRTRPPAARCLHTCFDLGICFC